MKFISKNPNLKGQQPERSGFIFLSSGSYTGVQDLLKNSRQMSKHSGNKGVIFIIYFYNFLS